MDWCRRPIVLLWLLTLPALTPFFQPTLTHSADGLLHLYRVVALDEAVRQGVLLPRWLPDLAYGYGLPLFVFYGPLSYYITEGLKLVGLNFVGAFNASFVLATLVAGSGVYLFTQDQFGSKAGLLAGVAYVYAPYQLFNNLLRGSLPVAWAAALFPLTFWAFGRLLRGDRRALPLSAFLCGLALLAHNISNLIFLPLLIFYGGVMLFYPHPSPLPKGEGVKNNPRPAAPHPRPLSQRARGVSPPPSPNGRGGQGGEGLLALALAFGLAAFFLLPAMAEQQFIQAERAITPPDFDYHTNFVNPADLFALPAPANTGLLNPTVPFTLGLPQLILAALGLAAQLLKASSPQKIHHSSFTIHHSPFTPPLLLFSLLSLAGLIFMTLPVSVGVWERLPLVAFVQQPHRLLGPASFLVAILAGAGVARIGFGTMVVGISLIFVGAVPLLYPRYYAPLPAPLTMPGMMAYEQSVGAIGTTSFGEYLPIWVKDVPREPAAGRLDHASLSAGATVKAETYSFNRADLTISSPEPQQLIFNSFYFPGWQARLDGQPAAITPTGDRGLIGVEVPAGRHRLQLHFGDTPIRTAANILSLISLIIIAWGSNPRLSRSSRLKPTRKGAFEFGVVLFGLALSLIAVKLLYLDRYDNPLKHTFDGATVAGAQVSQRVSFGHQVNLLGYDLDRQAAAPGEAFRLTLYWQAAQPLTTDYSALVHLVDAQNHLYVGQDNLHPGDVPMSRWSAWGFVRDPHEIRVPPGTPPGDYLLAVGLYDPATWQRLVVVAGGVGDTLPLPVTLTRPAQPPTVAELGIAWPAKAEFGPALRLLGATPEREAIRRNDFLRVALFWEATTAPPADYQVGLRLVTDAGAVVVEETTRPSHGRYPTTGWSANERVRDNHAVWIGNDLPPGTYRLEARLLGPDEEPPGASWVALGELAAE